MTSRSESPSDIRYNLYALMSLSPIVDDRSGVSVYCCIPVDLGADGTIRSDSRYCTVLVVPPSLQTAGLLALYDPERAYSAQWLTFCWGCPNG